MDDHGAKGSLWPRTGWPADRLTKAFGLKSPPAKKGIAALAAAIGAADSAWAADVLRRWEARFLLGPPLDERPEAVKTLKTLRTLGHRIAPSPPAPLPLGEGRREAALLLAIHTYYALIVKLLAGQVVADARGVERPSRRIAQATGEGTLRDEMAAIESGELFAPVRPFADPTADPLTWYLDAWTGDLAQWLQTLATELARVDTSSSAAWQEDVLGRLYQDLLPRKLRHALGEYYTPDWLVDHVLDQTGLADDPSRRLLDPSCGSGAFLIAILRRRRAQLLPSPFGSEELLGGVAGFDVNPLAVLTARAGCLLAVADLLSPDAPIELPVVLRDTILDPAGPEELFDAIVGNPPWIAWDNLPGEYREKTKALWREYGLFTLSGNAARHGGGKKDLAMLLLYAAADRYLRPGGRLSMVVTQTLFQSKGAGDGFRRFQIGDAGPPLRVLRVDDLVRVKPFAGAANWTAVIALEKGRPTEYPVPYVKWDRTKRQEYDARPIDPHNIRSPWLLLPTGVKSDLARLAGPSDYAAHLGANSGGANAVYWIELLGQTPEGLVRIRNLVGKAKRRVERVEAVVEPGLVYPLLRWGDVGRYRAVPGAWLLLVQDVQRRQGLNEALMRREYPKTLGYLERFRSLLETRAAYRRYQEDGPFYAMYNVGPYTVAPTKVVWRRMDRRINAAVVEPVVDPMLGVCPVVAQETCVQIEAATLEEAHYLCASLNSAAANFLATAHGVDGGKGFGTPGMLDFLRLRRFDPADPRHAELASLGAAAHQAAAGSTSDLAKRDAEQPALAPIQRRIDALAADVWGFDARDVDVLSRA